MRAEDEDEDRMPGSSSPSKRPKRQSSARSVLSENGLLWREERELKRALYASLQESSRIRPNQRGYETESVQQQKQQQDEDKGQDSPKKAKVHAQRKFAQGSTPNSPVPTPVKVGRGGQQTPNLSSLDPVFRPCRTRPKTEDFLTFLCLRGSQVLPPSLEFFNQCWPHNNVGGEGDSDYSEKSYYSEELLLHTDEKGLCGNGGWGGELDDRAKLTGSEIAAFHRQASAKLSAVKRKLASGQLLSGQDKRRKNEDKNIRNAKLNSSTAKRVKALKEKYRRLENQQQSKKSGPIMDTSRTGNVTKVGRGRPRRVEKVEPRKKLSESSIKAAKLKKSSLRSATLHTSGATNSTKSIHREVPRKAKLVPTIVEVDSEEEFETQPLATRSKRSVLPFSVSEEQQKRTINKKDGKPVEIDKRRSSRGKSDELLLELPMRRIPRDMSQVVVKSKTVPGRFLSGSGKALKELSNVKRVTRSQVIVPVLKQLAATKQVSVRVHRMRLERTDAQDSILMGDSKRQLFVVKDLRKGKTKLSPPLNVRYVRSPPEFTRGVETRFQKPAKKVTSLHKKKGDDELTKEHFSLAKKSKIVKTNFSQGSKTRVGKTISPAKAKINKAKKTSLRHPSPESSKSESTPPTGQLLSTPDRQGAAMMATIAGSSNDLPTALDQEMMPMMLSSEEEIQGLMTREFSGVFDDAFPTNALLLSSPQNGNVVTSTVTDTVTVVTENDPDSTTVDLDPLDVVSPAKSVADAATNTCEEDILLATGAIALKEEEIDEDDIPVALLMKSAMVTSLLQTPEKQSSSLIGNSSSMTTSGGKIRPGLAGKRNKAPKPVKVCSLRNIAKKQEQFPYGPGASAKMVEAPLYAPTPEEFQDPLEFIRKVQQEAAPYGICRIIPPATFKPECKVNDDMRFTAHNQYVHKMLYRWGPNVQQYACIRKHLASQGITLNQAPLIGGMELDLARLYRTVQSFGGLQQVVEKKKWQRIADALHIPKTAQDRVNKLYDIYCKYLVAYDTLPRDEKDILEAQVKAEHEASQKSSSTQETANSFNSETSSSSETVVVKTEAKDSSDNGLTLEEETANNDCVTKGRSMSLSSFYRVARNTLSMWCKRHTTPEEVERDYWKLVTERQHHVVVHAGNIDSSVYGSGFSSSRSSVFCKHPWNLKVLTNNTGTLLRAMGPVSGVTIPTLHVGMLYTTGCWYRDPHALPWIEYLHTGAPKIWYGVPWGSSDSLHRAMQEIMPSVCTDKPLWLPSDTAMVPPSLLVDHGSSLSRTVQESGQFVVIFPGTFVSSLYTGYAVSESVYFAPQEWLQTAKEAFQAIRNSSEPAAFSLERLLFCLAEDVRTQFDTLTLLLPWLQEIRDREAKLRSELYNLGVTSSERLPRPHEFRDKRKRSRGFRLSPQDEGDNECDICRVQCYVSKVVHSGEESLYCLEHAVEVIRSKESATGYKLAYSYHQDELEKTVKEVSEQMQLLSSKKKSKTTSNS